MEVPVYVFTGFLEAGKTRFIQETLEDKRFNAGEKTLLLLCEEGVEEYDPTRFSSPQVYVQTVEEEAELTAANMTAWLKKNGCRRSFCVDVYTTKGIRFHESNRIDSCILMKFSAYKIRIS